MAEGILFDAVGRILEVLGSQIFQEVGLAYSVKDEIRKLMDTMNTISGVLLDAEEQYGKTINEVTVWLRRLKDAVYDADDLLEDFHTELKRREMMGGSKMSKEVRIFFSKSNQVAYSLKTGHKIRALRERLEEIKNDKQFLIFKPRNGKGVMDVINVKTEREQTHSFVLPEKVIGREGDKNAILQVLLYSNTVESVSEIPIVGIGGIGKTTVVQSVFNVKEVIKHFELRMWVCVSDDFNLKTIVEKIIKSITGREIGNLEMDQVQQWLREKIDGKKYLLVLDDIWNENPNRWGTLKDLLMNGARGTKIIVTTRSQHVAKVTSKLPFYVLRGLTEDQSWTLFTQVAFEQSRAPKESKLVTIGKDIVAKCLGVHLAIKTIGRLLYDKNDEDYWLSFRDTELSKIPQEEDYELKKEEIIRLWMAQGFICRTNRHQCLEDVGNEYFIYLLSRSFFEEFRQDNSTCKMHDLMHDLAQLIAGSECTMVTLDSNSVDVRTRHLSFDSDLELLPTLSALPNANSLRTFLPLCRYFQLNESHLNNILSSFQRFCALNLRDLQIVKLPTVIGKLKHLRYLNLSGNEFEKLPNSVSKLINLQTLDLTSCYKLEELPKDMRMMVSLECLMIENCHALISMPHGFGKLTGVRTLSWFVVDEKGRKNDAVRELSELNKLEGRLTIRIVGDGENIMRLAKANLEAKPYLESMEFKKPVKQRRDMAFGPTVEGLKPHPNLKELTISGLGSVRFSGCMSSLTNLTTISIEACGNCETISPLDQLPSLERLFLRRLYKLEYMCDRVNNSFSSSSTTFFPSLKVLDIWFCGLKGWWK